MVKILLVDDNNENLMTMEVVLEREDYLLYKATSGREALKILLKEADFSLILLDVRMPIMDGYETAELIYQRDKLKHIPIIFITGQDYEENAVFKGYEAGAVDYIRKPFNQQILRSKVAVFAELTRKNQKLQQQEESLRLKNIELTRFNQELENRVKVRTVELQNLNEELKNLNHSKDKFLSVISHDLRNPLTALLASSARLSRDAVISQTEVKHLSSIINRTSNKILDQLNELVEWAKKQRQKTSFYPTKIKLIEGIDEALELLKTNASQKRISFNNNIEQNIYVEADGLMLRSILQNLVMNAIKYTPQGGSISVTAIPSEKMVEICVQDNGIGMSEEVQHTLFTKFSPVSINGTNNEQGSGLGLLLVRDFISQHGGSIYVESEVGLGTCFKFTIPISSN